jgi:hypothetical protein
LQEGASLVEESSLLCQVLVVNMSLPQDALRLSIAAFDVATGEQTWSWLMSDGPAGSIWDLPILPPSQSDHLFALTLREDLCFPPLYNITRVSYLHHSGAQADWSTSLGCHSSVGWYYSALAFPARTHPQSGAERPELLLFVADSWLILHGGSGEVLYQNASVPYAIEVAMLGDGSAHQFLTLVLSNDTAEARITSHQLHGDGHWTELASASYDSSLYTPVMVEAFGTSFARQGAVLVLQSLMTPDRLHGIDTLTGQQVWSASGSRCSPASGLARTAVSAPASLASIRIHCGPTLC